MEFSSLSAVQESQIFHFRLVQIHPKPVSNEENEDMINEANVIVDEDVDEDDHLDWVLVWHDSFDLLCTDKFRKLKIQLIRTFLYLFAIYFEFYIKSIWKHETKGS